MARSVKALPVKLDVDARAKKVIDFEGKLRDRIIGQDEAVGLICETYQRIISGLCPVNRPLANLLFVGPTGAGKTRSAEAIAEILYGSPQALIKVDCAEFQHSHEIAKLIGSPPGYLGHRETPPLLTQEAIDQYRIPQADFSILLFDEIEKANEALWRLLLGIMDKGRLTLGDNRKVDMGRTIIVLTSNVGAREMAARAAGKDIGFLRPTLEASSVKSIADIEIKRRFDPEFINRLDHTVVFESLSRDHYRKILDLEMASVQTLVNISIASPIFYLKWTGEAAEFLIDEGVSAQYGARELKRVINKKVVVPLANLISTGQIESGETVIIDMEDDHLSFYKPAPK